MTSSRSSAWPRKRMHREAAVMLEPRRNHENVDESHVERRRATRCSAASSIPIISLSSRECVARHADVEGADAKGEITMPTWDKLPRNRSCPICMTSTWEPWTACELPRNRQLPRINQRNCPIVSAATKARQFCGSPRRNTTRTRGGCIALSARYEADIADGTQSPAETVLRTEISDMAHQVSPAFRRAGTNCTSQASGSRIPFATCAIEFARASADAGVDVAFAAHSINCARKGGRC